MVKRPLYALRKEAIVSSGTVGTGRAVRRVTHISDEKTLRFD
jgi:hypothetical protein